MPASHFDLEGKRVVLGLSGGVDSAVAAILLKDSGADVHALHMTNWEDEDGYCTAAADLQDARAICEQLAIPLHHVNFSAQYRDRVFQHFLNEYRAGRTPNPDVLCNREIKFGVFRTHAHRLGGELLATGHYARIRSVNGETHLLKARDKSKDQSYFLHAVSEEALSQTVFPLGELEKDEVRLIARENGLDVHNKKDSTGICFIGERPFREFLETYLPARPGVIRSVEGDAVGEHHGLMYYTLGQRQGLGIGGRREASEAPWYVAAKNLDTNELVVVQGDHPLLYSASFEATDAHWIGALDSDNDPRAANGLSCAVKIRYRQEDQPCQVRESRSGRLIVHFDNPQSAVTPGQYAVFYSNERCLGGAVIDRTHTITSDLRKAG